MTATLELQPGRHRAPEEPEQVGALGVKAGDIFYASWGYDQTNVDWYLVVGLTASGKSAKIRKIGSLTEGDPHAPSHRSLPNVEYFPDEHPRWCGNCRKPVREFGELHPRAGVIVHSATDETYCIDEDGYEIPGSSIPTPKPQIWTKLIQGGPGHVYLSWESYANLYLWDGESKHETGFGWGH